MTIYHWMKIKSLVNVYLNDEEKTTKTKINECKLNKVKSENEMK